MRILSRLPARRAPMAVATVGAPVRRVIDPPVERALHHAAPTEESPAPLAPARGIVLALAVGALCWALLAAFLIAR
jgi:hypothetical protein